MAYTLVTEGMTEPERLAFDDYLLQWRATTEPAAIESPKTRETAIAGWGTSPEAEAGLAAFIAQEGLVTA